MSEKKVTITCTEKQLALLEMVCDRYSRLICGQLENSLQDICEEAWKRNHKTSEHPYAIGSEDWYTMRHTLRATLRGMREQYWGLTGGSYNGISYDMTADALYDMYQCMRYARYLNMPKDKQELLRMTVMADTPMRFGEPPLIEVKYETETSEEDNILQTLGQEV